MGRDFVDLAIGHIGQTGEHFTQVGAVNYALFGRANALCWIAYGQDEDGDKWSLEHALSMINLYKTRYLWDQLGQAKAFTQFGYNYSNPESSALPMTSSNMIKHSADPKNVVPYSEFTIHWEGL
jgi:hypothetical protein